MEITSKDLQDQGKMKFLMKIKNSIDGLELQRSRICASSGISAVHDAGYYMILLRRLYREIEEIAKCDSRIANLKGKNKGICQKIKMRDDFEHGVEKDVQLDKEILIDLGISSKESSGNVRIQTSVYKKGDSISIISGNILWDMSQDHQIFLKMVTEFVSLYPFKNEKHPSDIIDVVGHKLTYSFVVALARKYRVSTTANTQRLDWLVLNGLLDLNMMKN
jgi:hypothetical protein